MNGLKVSFSLSSEADNWGKVASFAKILASKKDGPKVRILTGFKPSGTNYALRDENWHDTIPEEYDVPGLASLDSPPVEADQSLYQRLLLALSFQRQERILSTYKNAT